MQIDIILNVIDMLVANCFMDCNNLIHIISPALQPSRVNPDIQVMQVTGSSSKNPD